MKNIKITNIKNFEDVFKIANSLPDYFTRKALRDFKKEKNKLDIYGAYIKNEMIGFVAFKKFNNNVIELYMIAIDRKMQNMGIGKLLLEKSLKKIGKKFKICKVKTLAEIVKDAGYARTRRFYKQIGFIPVEIVDPYPGWDKGNPCQIFIKYLN